MEFFFSLLLFMVAVDLAYGWWRRWWVDVVVDGAGLRKKETGKDKDKEREEE